jgi:hypothetical protein
MSSNALTPTTVYATRVRDGISKIQYIWIQEEGEPEPNPNDTPAATIQFNQGFILNEEDAKGWLNKSQALKELKWFDEQS